jgi:hypothetical protein
VAPACAPPWRGVVQYIRLGLEGAVLEAGLALKFLE